MRIRKSIAILVSGIIMAMCLVTSSIFAFADNASGGISNESLIVGGEGVTYTGIKTNKSEAEEIAEESKEKFKKTGLTVKGDTGYSAEFAGIFEGDTMLNFAFLGETPTGREVGADGGYVQAGAGSFKFTVADANDPEESFDITMQGGWFMTTFVTYKGQTRRSSFLADENTGVFLASHQNNKNASIYTNTEGDYVLTGGAFCGLEYDLSDIRLRLVWDNDDKLYVTVSRYYAKQGEQHDFIVACFDGTEQIDNKTDADGATEFRLGDFGLPKMTGMKKNGYRISFSSDFEGGSDVCFQTITTKKNDGSVETLSFARAEDIETPSWHDRFTRAVKITLEEKAVTKWNPQLGGYTIPQAFYTIGGNATKKPCKVAYKSKTDGDFKAITDPSKPFFAPFGTYEFRFAVDETGSTEYLFDTYTFETEFVNGALPSDIIADGDGVTVVNNKTTETRSSEISATNRKKFAQTGLTVSGNQDYTAQFNGVFIGDTTLEFSLLGDDCIGSIGADGGYNDVGNGSFTFTVTDAKNPEESFDISYIRVDGCVQTHVIYKGKTRLSNALAYAYGENAGKFADTGENGNAAVYDAYTPWIFSGGSFCGASRSYPDMRLKLKWDGDVLNVIVNRYESYDRQYDYIVARFDGTPNMQAAYELSTGEKVKPQWGLKKLSGIKENGYRISFSSDHDSAINAGTDVCFKSINGVSCDGATWGDGTTVTEERFVLPVNDVSANRTKDLLGYQDVDTGVSLKYAIRVGNDTNRFDGNAFRNTHYADEFVTGAQTIDFTTANEYSVNYSFGGANVARKLCIVDAPPEVRFRAGINETTYWRIGDPALRFGESDIEAIDGFDGRLSFADADVMLTVTVTDPKGNTFEALENAPYVPTEKGVYKAEYTVVNKTDAPVKAVRYIHVSGAVLRIAVHKDIPTSAYVGSEFAIPAATVYAGDTIADTVPVIAVRYSDGETITAVAVSDGKVVFDRAGEYEIGYYASCDGEEVRVSYKVNVQADTLAPEIRIGAFEGLVRPGQNVILPEYTANDDLSGVVPVTVAVFLGTAEIEVRNGEFAAKDEGVYRIVLTAEDAAGNRSEKTVFLTVSWTNQNGSPVYVKKLSDGAIAGIVIGSILGAAAIAAGITILVFRQKKKKATAAHTNSDAEVETDGNTNSDAEVETDGNTNQNETK